MLFSHSFRDKFVDGMKFDIEFTFPRYPLRNMHHAVEMATGEGGVSDVLFPNGNNNICTKEAFPNVPELE